MKSIRLATAAAVVTGLFAASSEAATTEWWSFDFNDVADIVALTNDNQAAWTTTGVWTTEDSDESAIIAAGDEKYQNETTALKLDTQGTELQWTLKDAARPEGTKTLIDADMYLVGAEDDPTGFDNGDVQAAIYLHSFTDENDVTTNYLCVYTYDGNANVWVPLQGTPVEDGSWHHVQVTVDYSGSVGSVSVVVDNMQMQDEDGNTSWTIANAGTIRPTKISSVSFKGTGAVDNFVGAVEAVSTVSYLFTGATFLDGAAIVAPDQYSAPTDPTTVGTSVEFQSDTVLFDPDTSEMSATLATVSIVTFDATGVATTTSYTFTYDEDEGDVVAPDGAPAGLFNVDGGVITVTAPTANATAGEGVTEIQIVTFNYASVGGGDEPIEAVEPGAGLADWDWGAEDPKAPVEVVPSDGTDPETFVIRFVGQAGVTYQLIAVDSLDDNWDTDAEAVGTAVTPAAIGIVELSAPMTEDAQFFKIKATK
jgi:hypothetical protein